MTTDFSRSYMPPGTYIDEDETTVLANSTGIPATLVALLGQAIGYETVTEQIIFGDTPATLSRKGVDTSTITMVAVSTRASVDSTFFTATKGSAGAAGDQDYQTTVAATNLNTLDDETPVFVTYQYTTPDYFGAKYVTSYDDVKALYGEPLNLAEGSASDPNYTFVTSPLSLAAKVAFENGATELVLVAVPKGTGGNNTQISTSLRSNLNTAYANIATLSAVNVVVPIPVGILTSDAAGVFTDLANYVNARAADGYRQFGVVGFDPAVSTAPDSLIATSGSANLRVMLAYATPAGPLMYSGGINATFAASHAYLAAGYAGRMASLNVQQSLTKQTISSFSGLAGTPLSNALKNQYAASGVAIAEVNRLGALTVRHGVTTDPTNINTREASVVRAKDALITMISNGFEGSGLIGDPIDDDLVYAVKSTMQQYLETAVQTGTIVDYSGLTCRQRPNDLQVIEVKFAYKPAYPLNYIAISFSVDMTTGVTDATDALAA